MISAEQSLEKAREAETFCLLGDLHCLLNRLRRQRSTNTAQHNHNQNQTQVSTWYSSLSCKQREEVNIVEATEPLSLEIKNVLQQGLISDVDILEPHYRLCWNTKSSTYSLKVIKRTSLFGDTIETSCKRSERLLLDHLNIVWNSSKPLEFRYFSGLEEPSSVNIASVMMSISQSECFSEPPSDLNDVKSLKWLRNKNCFSLGQLQCALLEMRIWRCYKKRKKLASYLSATRSKECSKIENDLHAIHGNCNSNVLPFKRIIHTKCNKVIHSLTKPDDTTVPLFLTIMKKRLINWQTYCTFPTSQQSCINLWTLHFFTSILFDMRPSPNLRENRPCRKALARPDVTSDLKILDIFRNLMTIPLFDSFSLLHEFRLLIRDGLIADHHESELLVQFEHREVAISSPSINSSKKKKNRKKRNKNSVRVQVIADNSDTEKKNSHQEMEVEKRDDSNCNDVFKSQDTSGLTAKFCEALAPRDIPPSLVQSTQTMVTICYIIEYILAEVFIKVSSRTIDVLEYGDTSAHDETISDNEPDAAPKQNDSDGNHFESPYKEDISLVSEVMEIVPQPNSHSHIEGHSETKLLPLSPTDSGFYDALYSLPSWVVAGDDPQGSISLSYFDGSESTIGTTGGNYNDGSPSDINDRSKLYEVSGGVASEEHRMPPYGWDTPSKLRHRSRLNQFLPFDQDVDIHEDEHSSHVNMVDVDHFHSSSLITDCVKVDSIKEGLDIVQVAQDRQLRDELQILDVIDEDINDDNDDDANLKSSLDQSGQCHDESIREEHEDIARDSSSTVESTTLGVSSDDVVVTADDQENDNSNSDSNAINVLVTNGATPEKFQERSKQLTHSKPPRLRSSQSNEYPIVYNMTATDTSPAAERRRSLSPNTARKLFKSESTNTKKTQYPPKITLPSTKVTEFVPTESKSIGISPRRMATESIESFGSQSDNSHINTPDTGRLRYPSQEDLFSSGNIILVFALTCAHMKSQAEGMVLRNIIALQRSLIIDPNNVGNAQPPFYQPSSFPFHLHSSQLRNNVHHSMTRDLEVMSDDGNQNFHAKRTSGRSSSLTKGAATVSSLVFNSQLSSNAESARGLSMRSVPNSPPMLPNNSLPLQDNMDIFPTLPTAYPTSYLNSAVISPSTPTPQQHQYAHDDEAITYSNRLLLPRQPSEATPHNQYRDLESVDGKDFQNQQPPPTPNTSPVPMYRPRSASVSRKPPIASSMSRQAPVSMGRLRTSTSSHNFRQLFEGIQLPPSRKRSYDSDEMEFIFESDDVNSNVDKTGSRVCPVLTSSPLPPRRKNIDENIAGSRNVLLRTASDEIDVMADISNQSAYTPLSYAAYAQNMFNYGGIGGIPTPLTREILSFVDRVDAVGAKMQSAKASAVLRLRHVVQQLWPRAQVKAFGSYVTGLSLPSSDLDLVICLPKVHHVAGPSAPGFIEGRNAIKETWQNILARCLRREDWVDVSSMKVIGNTAVPVIKLNTKSNAEFHVSLDISFGGHGHQGLEACELSISLIREYPSLRPIVLVLKQFLTRRGLCEVFTGGLSSYAILLLTVRFLQEQSHSMPTDIGASLLGILDFYGNHLQPSVTGISVANMCYFSRKDNNEVINAVPYSRAAINRRHSLRLDATAAPLPPTMQNDSYRPYKFDPLFIEDPLDKGNNVGRNCFRVQQVQRVFCDAHKSLIDSMAGLEMHGFRDCESFSLLNLLVGDLDTV